MNMMGKENIDTRLLDVSDLAVQFRVPKRGGFFYQESAVLKAVDGVSFSMTRGKHLDLLVRAAVGNQQQVGQCFNCYDQVVVVSFLMESQYMNFGKKKVRSGYGINVSEIYDVECK